MSEQEFYIEWTGNIQVHHPVKREAEVIQYADWFTKEWETVRDAA
jgi:hypothetical protein